MSKPRILINVSGGLITDILSDSDIEVTVLDQDLLQCGPVGDVNDELAGIKLQYIKADPDFDVKFLNNIELWNINVKKITI